MAIQNIGWTFYATEIDYEAAAIAKESIEVRRKLAKRSVSLCPFQYVWPLITIYFSQATKWMSKI